MYTNRNFELLPEYRERVPRVPRARVQEVQDVDLEAFAAIGGAIIQGFTYLCTAVVILFAAGLLVAIVGWLWSFTQTPQHQPLTERKQNEYLQAERRSPARSGGGERSSSPPAERSTPTQSRPTQGGAQAAPQNEVVVKEQGASAPSFHWFCFRGSMLCEVQDSMGNTIQEFWLENWSIRSSAIHSSYGRLPPAWGCGVKEQKLDCSFQDGRGRILQRFLYDGQNIQVIENAE